MVGGREQRVVTRVDRRVVDPPAVEQRTLDLPPAAVVIAPEKEEPFARADKCEDADRWTYLALCGIRGLGDEWLLEPACAANCVTRGWRLAAAQYSLAFGPRRPNGTVMGVTHGTIPYGRMTRVCRQRERRAWPPQTVGLR
jgi:hypothetical protein